MDRQIVLDKCAMLKKEAQQGGYRLNPDDDFVFTIVEGLLENEQRYGFFACPCRLIRGDEAENKDIICPCVYRDDDLSEYGACFCALYVSSEDISGPPTKQIPERRPSKKERENAETKKPAGVAQISQPLPYPIYRCSVCGYLCANHNPPGICPICKAKKDRFERFI